MGEAAHHHSVNSGSDYFSITIKNSDIIYNQSLPGSLCAFISHSEESFSITSSLNTRAHRSSIKSLHAFFPSTKWTIHFCLTANQAPKNHFCDFHHNVEIPVRFSSLGMILPLLPMEIPPTCGPKLMMPCIYLILLHISTKACS